MLAHSAYRQVAELLHAAAVLNEAGFLPATDGNFSARIDDQRILLTASGIEKRELDESSLIEVSLDDVKPHRASSEWLMHRALYLGRADVGAVLHVHSPALTAFAAAHRVPRMELLSEAAMTLGPIVLVPFHRPGTSELAQALLDAHRQAGIYLLANHGAVAVGATVREALHRLERAEFLARAEWMAESLGGGVPLTHEQLAFLQDPSRQSGNA